MAREPGKKSSRTLGLALGGVVALLGVVAVLTTILGSPNAGDPKVALNLAPPEPERQAAPSVSPGGGGARYVNGNAVSDLTLTDETPQGSVPRIGDDGRMPLTAFGAAFNAKETRPKIAIVLMGVGISSSGTSLALSRLPAQIAFAFVPFGLDVQSLVDQTRGKGHEVLLEVPMEPFDFPDSDPGPNPLLAAAAPQENEKRLYMSLSKMTGYVGVTNLMGGRFLGENAAVEPLLGVLAKRGLMFFDSGQNANSVATTAARHAGTANARANVVLDSIQTPDAIDMQLQELEAQARQNGSAIGTASLYVVSIDRIAEWAVGLESRGFVLAPLTAVAFRPQVTLKQ